MEKNKYKVIEVFNEEGKDVKDVLKEIFKSYVKEKLNSYNDLKLNNKI